MADFSVFAGLPTFTTQPPDSDALAVALRRLGRKVEDIGPDGYHRHVMAGAVDEPTGRVVYIEERVEPEPHGLVDVTLRVHRLDADGTERVADLETYNPYFGATVRLLR
ncbi:MAG: hypothetical protein AAGK21_13160 [Bacteroidota bacterium]